METLARKEDIPEGFERELFSDKLILFTPMLEQGYSRARLLMEIIRLMYGED